MKKLLSSLLLLGFLSMPVSGEPLGIKLGPLELQLPLQDTKVVYLYDLVNEESLAGAETTIASLGKINITIGAVVNADNIIDAAEGNEAGSREGLPFIGLDINTSGNGVLLERLNIGGFISRNSTTGEAMAGIKTSIRLYGEQ